MACCIVPVEAVRFACEDCQSSDAMVCPRCGHNCELQAKTLRTDEDAHCCKCNLDLVQTSDGTALVPDDGT